MSDHKRQAILVGVTLAMLLVVAGWSALGMLAQRRAARHAAEDLAVCTRIAERIGELRSNDAVASAEGDTATQEDALAQRIDEAAAKAGLTGAWQQGLEHERAARVGDTPYLRKPALLMTRGLTLGQLTALLHHLTHDSPYTAEDLRLYTPQGADPAGRWDADVTLTYLIYAPPSANRPGR